MWHGHMGDQHGGVCTPLKASMIELYFPANQAASCSKYPMAEVEPWKPHGWMMMMMLKAVQVIGIDLSKIQPDVSVHPVFHCWLEPR